MTRSVLFYPKQKTNFGGELDKGGGEFEIEVLQWGRTRWGRTRHGAKPVSTNYKKRFHRRTRVIGERKIKP